MEKQQFDKVLKLNKQFKDNERALEEFAEVYEQFDMKNNADFVGYLEICDPKGNKQLSHSITIPCHLLQDIFSKVHASHAYTKDRDKQQLKDL